MSIFIKRIIFAFYVFLVRKRRNKKSTDDISEKTFIWKHAYFFFWHNFLWRNGRNVRQLFGDIRPLNGELFSKSAMSHYDNFCLLSTRDRNTRPLEERILRQTTFRLADDTVKALCYFYMHMAFVAPWQYAVEVRLRALRRIRKIFFVLLLLMFVISSRIVPPSPIATYLCLLVFFATLFAGVGWYADKCLYDLAQESQKMKENK